MSNNPTQLGEFSPLAPGFPHTSTVASLRGKPLPSCSFYPPPNAQANNLGRLVEHPTQNRQEVYDIFLSFGSEVSSATTMTGTTGSEGLLDFGITPERTPAKLEVQLLGRNHDDNAPKPSIAQLMARAKTEPGEARVGPSSP